MVTGIEHTAIASPDPERLARWYVDHLGFQINYQSSNSRTHFVKAPDGSMIEIIESKGAAAPPAGMKDAGIRHMALTVADFPGACEKLKALGVEFVAEPANVGGNSTVFFRDCDGNILHLLHREKPLGE
jgi:glyoxylase I family protein